LAASYFDDGDDLDRMVNIERKALGRRALQQWPPATITMATPKRDRGAHPDELGVTDRPQKKNALANAMSTMPIVEDEQRTPASAPLQRTHPRRKRSPGGQSSLPQAWRRPHGASDGGY
jgi:hypothetical protein